MEKIKVKRRIHGTLTSAQQRRLQKAREEAADELPDLVHRNELRFNARKERTFSGFVRRAIYRFPQSPMEIADRAEIEWKNLSSFLTGESALPSDAIDRLVNVLKLKLPTSKPRRTKSK